LKKINPALKIIMASGGGTEKTATPPDSNISAFAPKPYTVEKLLTIVHEVLQPKGR
jgi:DNA-binding NtrC family response regulator